MAVRQAIEQERPFDAFIFLGDGEDEYSAVTMNMGGTDTYCVRGNCDWGSMTTTVAAVEVKGHRFLICHGHTFGVREGLDRLSSAAVLNDCEAALFGHTHCRCLCKEDGITLFNPGSISLPRDGQPPSYGLITEEKGELLFRHKDLYQKGKV